MLPFKDALRLLTYLPAWLSHGSQVLQPHAPCSCWAQLISFAYLVVPAMQDRCEGVAPPLSCEQDQPAQFMDRAVLYIK